MALHEAAEKENSKLKGSQAEGPICCTPLLWMGAANFVSCVHSCVTDSRWVPVKKAGRASSGSRSRPCRPGGPLTRSDGCRAAASSCERF